ncbi:MAG: MarR family transcriptional regulator [Candidatus Obscuribacterales bacterium]|nr:MarR family transcriptional regulator [Cyanobacteria bacterium SZAS LIN-5]
MIQQLGDNPERTQEAVLVFIKRMGEVTVADLCKELGITSMAVRRHIAALQKDGLVHSRIVRQSRGRPTYHYKLTEKAEGLFPTGFQNLAVDLLDVVYEQSGDTGVMDLLSRRNDKMADRFKSRVIGKDMKGKVAEVAKIFSENGYMTEWETLPDGNFIIFQRHCAVHDLALQYQQLCVLEPQLMENLLGVKVTRQQYILKNDPVCGYVVPNLPGSTEEKSAQPSS